MEYHIDIQTNESGDIVTGVKIAGVDADTRLGIEQDGDTFEADGPYGRTTYDSLVYAVLSSLGEIVPAIDEIDPDDSIVLEWEGERHEFVQKWGELVRAESYTN